MSEHPGLEFAPQSPRSQILPSMSPLVLFIISTPFTLYGLHRSAAIFIPDWAAVYTLRHGMVEKTECGVSLQSVFLDLAVIFKQTPSFPLYRGIK